MLVASALTLVVAAMAYGLLLNEPGAGSILLLVGLFSWLLVTLVVVAFVGVCYYGYKYMSLSRAARKCADTRIANWRSKGIVVPPELEEIVHSHERL